jgi:hypothetical protein
MRKREILKSVAERADMPELSMDQIDEVVVSELQFALEAAIVAEKDEGGYYLDIDMELVNALTVTLKYFMDRDSYQSYMNYVTNLTIK